MEFAKHENAISSAKKETQTCLNVIVKSTDGSSLPPYPKQQQTQMSFTSTLSEIMIETLIPAHALSSRSWEKLAAKGFVDQRLTVRCQVVIITFQRK